MRILIGLAAAAIILPAEFLSSGLLATPEAQPQSSPAALSATTECADQQSGEVLLHGTLSIVRDGAATGHAVLYSDTGRAVETHGFGLTGEVMVATPDRELETVRIELGQAVDIDPRQSDLVQCHFSEITTEERVLTQEDTVRLGVSDTVAGSAAETTVSIHGVAWVVRKEL